MNNSINLKNQSGFIKTNELKNVRELVVSYELSDAYKEPEEFVKEKLVYKLSKSIIENNLAIFNKYKNFDDFSNIFTATINVVDPGKRYVNIIDEKFMVNGEIFTNDELVQAVKNTFPERLL